MQKNNILKEIDEFIFDVYKKVNIYEYLTPTNLQEENRNFIDNFKKGIEYNPIYNYKIFEENSNIDAILNKLEYYKSKIESNKDIISKKLLYALEELSNNIYLCKNIGNSIM